MFSKKNRKESLISVITVCLNAEGYIRQCLESVIDQNFDDYEYIVIDGGSTDNTWEIIKEYENSLAYWHSKPDRGLSHAFNQGLEQANGKWIIFLNSDDYFADSQVLNKCSSVLRTNPDQDVIFGQVQRVSRESEPKALDRPIGHPFNWKVFLKRNTIPHPSAFTNRDFFRRAGAFYEDYRFAMDYEFYLRGGKDLKAMFHPLIITCMREGGLSRANRRESLYECLRALNQHQAWPGLYILLYGNYLRFRNLFRDLLVKSRVISE